MSVQSKVSSWESFPDNSEVWIYQADRTIEPGEIESIANAGNLFVQQWNTHGTAMSAGFTILYNRFLILIADPNTKPSGCSKDSMVHFVQNVGKELKIDFFNRMEVLYRTDTGQLASCALHDLSDKKQEGQVHEKTIVFNNLAQTKAQFDSNWETTISNSWHMQFLN